MITGGNGKGGMGIIRHATFVIPSNDTSKLVSMLCYRVREGSFEGCSPKINRVVGKSRFHLWVQIGRSDNSSQP